MEYIRVTKENLEKEHICCAISNNKDVQVSSKKAWLAERFDEGLVFLKSMERGKCFIKYIPAEYAWNPIDASGYMYIDCLWVSGSFKGHGYSSDLLSECIRDSREKGEKGLCILAAAKKKPFLADPKFLKYKGFEVGDESDNGIQLWYLPFEKGSETPMFKECAKHPHTMINTDYNLYNQYIHAANTGKANGTDKSHLSKNMEYLEKLMSKSKNDVDTVSKDDTEDAVRKNDKDNVTQDDFRKLYAELNGINYGSYDGDGSYRSMANSFLDQMVFSNMGSSKDLFVPQISRNVISAAWMLSVSRWEGLRPGCRG